MRIRGTPGPPENARLRCTRQVWICVASPPAEDLLPTTSCSSRTSAVAIRFGGGCRPRVFGSVRVSPDRLIACKRKGTKDRRTKHTQRNNTSPVITGESHAGLNLGPRATRLCVETFVPEVGSCPSPRRRGGGRARTNLELRRSGGPDAHGECHRPCDSHPSPS